MKFNINYENDSRALVEDELEFIDIQRYKYVPNIKFIK